VDVAAGRCGAGANAGAAGTADDAEVWSPRRPRRSRLYLQSKSGDVQGDKKREVGWSPGARTGFGAQSTSLPDATRYSPRAEGRPEKNKKEARGS
jgi:hypothetical protein